MALLSNVIGRGVVASRPAAGSPGALYYATDVSGGQLQRDNGSSWDSVEFGGGGTGTVTSVSGTAPVAVATGTTTPVISVPAFVASGGSHAAGLVPDPGSSAGTTRFLREDSSWQVPAGGGNFLLISHDTPAASAAIQRSLVNTYTHIRGYWELYGAGGTSEVWLELQIGGVYIRPTYIATTGTARLGMCGASTSQRNAGVFEVFLYNNTTSNKMGSYWCMRNDNGSVEAGGWYLNNTGAITGLQIVPDSSTLTGTVDWYGLS